jgi:hypothetical protein
VPWFEAKQTNFEGEKQIRSSYSRVVNLFSVSYKTAGLNAGLLFLSLPPYFSFLKYKNDIKK